MSALILLLIKPTFSLEYPRCKCNISAVCDLYCCCDSDCAVSQVKLWTDSDNCADNGYKVNADSCDNWSNLPTSNQPKFLIDKNCGCDETAFFCVKSAYASYISTIYKNRTTLSTNLVGNISNQLQTFDTYAIKNNGIFVSNTNGSGYDPNTSLLTNDALGSSFAAETNVNGNCTIRHGGRFSTYTESTCRNRSPCASNTYLDPAYYTNQQFYSQRLGLSSNLITVTANTVGNISASATTCSNAVVSAVYNIQIDSTDIIAVNVTLTTADLSISSGFVNTFMYVQYLYSTTTTFTRLSGFKGYQNGNDVLFVSTNTATSFNRLYIELSDSAGNCNTALPSESGQLLKQAASVRGSLFSGLSFGNNTMNTCQIQYSSLTDFETNCVNDNILDLYYEYITTNSLFSFVNNTGDTTTTSNGGTYKAITFGCTSTALNSACTNSWDSVNSKCTTTTGLNIMVYSGKTGSMTQPSSVIYQVYVEKIKDELQWTSADVNSASNMFLNVTVNFLPISEYAEQVYFNKPMTMSEQINYWISEMVYPFAINN